MSRPLDDYEVVDGVDTLETKQVLDIPDNVFTINVGKEKFEIRHAHFNIDEENLTEEACMLGQYMVYYGDIFAKARAELATEEHARKSAYSKLYIDIRRDMKDPKSELYKKINEKMTEGYIENYITSMPEYTAIVNREYRVRVTAFRAEAWWKAIQKKADLLNMLGYRQNTEMKKGY